MRIGEVADATGVSTSTIRYYEKYGLLAPAARKRSGYRDYSAEDVHRLRLIAQARMLSIPLPEVQDIVGMAFEGKCDPLRTGLLSAVRRRLADTRRQIRELRSLQRELERVSVELANEARTSQARSGADPCSCLDGLTSSHRAEKESSQNDHRKEERHMSDKVEEPEKPATPEPAEPQDCGCGCMRAKAETEESESAK